MNVDLTGTESVCEYIRHSKMNYYYIHKYPSQSGSLAVYECTSQPNANAAAIHFQEWANIVNSGSKNFQQYQITICNHKEGEDEDLKRQRSKKIRASFVFYKEDEPIHVPQNNFINGANTPMVNMQQQIDEKIASLRTELTLKHENEKLQERIDDLEDELDEIGEADKQPDYMTKLFSLLADKAAPKKELPKATLAGAPQHDWVALKETIRILLKHDPDLPSHLSKLADLAENNTAKFHLVIQMFDQNL